VVAIRLKKMLMPSHPKHIVVMSMIACAVLMGGNALLSKRFPSYKQVGGGFSVFLMLAIGVEFAPGMSAMFALLVLVIVFLNTFDSLSKQSQSLLAGKSSKSSKSSVEGKGGGFSTRPPTAEKGGGGGDFGAV